MLYKIILYFFILIVAISCNNQQQKKYDASLIDKEKIDAYFDQQISSLLLDHMYIVLDSLSYDRLIKDPQWGQKYGTLDKGLPLFAPIDANAPECYLRGHQHYIEILGPNNMFNEPVGKSGIGFALKNDDQHFHLGVEPKLKVENTAFLNATDTVTMSLDNRKEVWFKAFYTPSPGTALHTWYAFYNPTFLDRLHGKHHRTYSREAFLESTYKDQKLFNGIREIYLNCTSSDYQRIAQELGHLGSRLVEKNGEKLTIVGGDITIHLALVNSVSYSRITQITCGLNAIDHSITELGNLTITNHGKESVWNFNKLYKNNL